MAGNNGFEDIKRAEEVEELNGRLVMAIAIEACREIDVQDFAARGGKFGGTHVLVSGPHHARLGILVEEVGEVSRELNEALIKWDLPDEKALRAELIQVAACAIAWAAAIDTDRAERGCNDA